MFPSTMFLMMAAILIAPHLSESSGKAASMVSLALALIFWMVELWIDK